VIRSPADWKGRRLGVTGLGSATELLTHALARRHGLKPQDYTVLPVGSGAAFAAALRQGRIDAGMSTEPVASSLIQSGEARLLVDLRSPEAAQKALGQSYPFASLYMQSAWVHSHPRRCSAWSRRWCRRCASSSSAARPRWRRHWACGGRGRALCKALAKAGPCSRPMG
jgi:NitT/TauT family transport system substrate-binding protein